MVRTDTWLGSGASVTFIPEAKLRYTTTYDSATTTQYRGSTSSGFTQDTTGNLVKIELDSDITAAYSALIVDLYQGCTMDIYQADAYVASYRIKYNDATAFYIEANEGDIADLEAATDYILIQAFGSPVPAPIIAGSGTLSDPTITTAGDDLLASQAIVTNTAISSALSGSSTGCELELTLSAHSQDITMLVADGTASAYQTGYITIHLASAGGDSTLAVAFDTASGTTKANSGFDDYVEVNIPNSCTAVNAASAVQTALEGKDVTVTRAGAKLSISNNTGGYVNSGILMTMQDSGGAVTDFGTLSNDVDGGIVTSVAVTNSGSSVTGTGNLTITSAAGTDAVLALAAGSANTALLSDNWLGLVTSISPPSVDIEMKQLNLALAGSRNWTYQYKGAHTISGVNLSLNANHGAWLYYALGACTKVVATDNTVNPTDYNTASAAANNFDDFYYNTLESVAKDDGPFFHRVIDGGTAFCPPLVDYAVNASAGTLGAGYKKITQPTMSSGTITNFITYELAESNTATLPSFALEFAYQKGTELGSASSTDSSEEVTMARIVTGNQVNTLTMTADENMELTMSVDLSSKALVEPAANYKVMRGEFDENEFVNFGSASGNQYTTYPKEQDFLTPFFFSEGSVKIWNTEYIRIQNVNLTINNTLTDKRFLGVNKKHKHAIPAQRTYEISFTGLVTDNKIFNELLNETADETTANQIELEFTKDNEEYIKLHFKNFMVTNNTWPLPEDKGPIVVEWTIQPLELVKADLKTHWIIQ